jgi:hypothetical protein
MIRNAYLYYQNNTKIMKKLIISLIASFLLCAFAYGQPNRPDPVEEHRKVEKWLEGHKAEAAKAERDLQVKIAEANKNPDKREVEIHVKNLVARHDAAMAGHAEERRNLEGRLTELKSDLVEDYRKVEKWLEGHKAEAAKAERDLQVKIAEANKNPDKREVEIHVKDLVARHDANMAGHAEERRNLENRLAELKENPEVAKWGKPEVLTDKEKLDPRKFEGEVLKQVKEGKLSQEDARKKLDSLRGEMEKRGEFKRPKRLQKPELSAEVKDKLQDLKDLQDGLAKEMKTKLDGLKKDGATREEMREAVHAFQKDNKVILEDIRERHAGIQQSLKDARPPKPERPELTAEIKVKVEALKEKQKELHTARKDLHENLKDKSKEDREELIADFKKDNKTKHEAIKAQAKEVKEEIRALVETEATRTSDL